MKAGVTALVLGTVALGTIITVVLMGKKMFDPWVLSLPYTENGVRIQLIDGMAYSKAVELFKQGKITQKDFDSVVALMGQYRPEPEGFIYW